MRWLHCSDFHFGKDRTAQERLVGKIIEHVKNRQDEGFVPDLIFVTGDIANRGQKREYEQFRQQFVEPLRRELGWSGSIFAVPGNHDVNREQNDAFSREEALASGSRFFDPDRPGMSKREILQPRFKSYRKIAVNVAGNWVSSPAGTFTEHVEIGGRRYGVVGINTAWLSKDAHDHLKLTPGVELVEAALDRVKDCSVRFVLGHHPLSWLYEEHQKRLRSLFGQHGVIYLHGHLHRAEGSREDGSGHDFLAVQAGAAFQARDDEPWRNGLLWGEVDVDASRVRLSPRTWNPEHRDWPVEFGRFPEIRRVRDTDWWEFPLPHHSRDSAKLPWQAPDGWEALSDSELQARRRDVGSDEAERFFDGAEPDWGLALSPKLPRRGVVAEIVEELTDYGEQERPLVRLLCGPGGEGKSMALRQTLAVLAARDETARILWHIDETRPLPAGCLAQLPPGRWIVATDNADLIAKSLLDAVAELHRIRRSDVKLLLCARDTDWHAAGADKLEWARLADYRTPPLSGLSEADAVLIATAWSAFENDDAPASNASERMRRGRELFEAAQREAAVSEGSLLGGVLAVRHGAGLRAHVGLLLDRLAANAVDGGGTLYDAFAYIAAMHAEKLEFLSRPVLGQVLGCSPAELNRRFIGPLAREAAAGGGSVLLTRHRRIAEAAVSIMKEERHEDMATLFERLARAAKQARQNHIHVPELGRWDYELPSHFTARDPEIAVRIARVLLDMSADNAKLAVNFARICREVHDAEAGMEALARFEGQIGDRGFWCEWGACADAAGEPAVGAVFTAWAVADQAAPKPPDVKGAELSLGGLSVAFGKLYGLYRDAAFSAGRSATELLLRKLVRDPVAVDQPAAARNAKPASTARSSPNEALTHLAAAIAMAWEVSGKPDAVTTRITSPERMTFNGLARLVAHR